MKNLGLYVHIPFCAKKCAYCDFVSFTNSASYFEQYAQAVCAEIEHFANKDYIVDTIYFGGGTPSLMPAKCVEQILNAIKSFYNVKSDAEITVEVNPNSVNENKALEYLKMGVNRISVGVQSLNNKSLRVLGRLHNAKNAVKTLKMLKKVGFCNVSADIMIGIPHLTMWDIAREIRVLAKYCQHISAYSLILEENTPLFNSVKQKTIRLPSEEKSVKQYNFALKNLKKCGFYRYEVSNFCKTGYQSKHNLKYWNMQEYLGLGVASHSFISNKREENPNSLEEYFNYIKSFKRKCETVNKTQLKEEYIMLQLRKAEGLNISDFNVKFNCNLLDNKLSLIKDLEKNNLIKIDKNFLFATDKGFCVLNQIILQLID